jgi:hypothetical protein
MITSLPATAALRPDPVILRFAFVRLDEPPWVCVRSAEV